MVIQSSQPEFWRLHKTLPEELKTAIGSMKTVNDIDGIVDRNNITEEEKVRLFTDLISNVLVGLLPPEEFREALVTELRLSEEQARQVWRETFRFIFYPVNIELGLLYKNLSQEQQEAPVKEPAIALQDQEISLSPPDTPSSPTPEELPQKKEGRENISQDTEETDPYRESIE